MLTKLKMTQKAAIHVTYTDELYDTVRAIAVVQVSGSAPVVGPVWRESEPLIFSQVFHLIREAVREIFDAH